MVVRKLKVAPRVKGIQGIQAVPAPIPKAPKEIKRRKPLQQQFEEKFVVTDIFPTLVTGARSLTPCWRWVGANNGKPEGRWYGIFGRPKQYAHRYSYEHYKKAIPTGFVIDHLCRHRWCVQPDHLDCVTTANNLKRGAHPNFKSHRTGMCAAGLHDLTKDENIYLRADGRAFCKKCNEIAREKRKASGIKPKSKKSKSPFNFVATSKLTNRWGIEE